MKKSLSILLSLTLLCFLLDGAISFLDDSLILGLGIHALTVPREVLSIVTLAAMVGAYLMIGISPMTPKRFVLPMVLFYIAGALVVFPVSIYHFARVQQLSWALSAWQLLIGFALVFRLHGSRARWPLLPEDRLEGRSFSVLNLATFVLANVFVLGPAVLIYLALCTSMAADHFSGGFVTLDREGIGVRARTYERPDGKTVQLIPMAHIGSAQFYAEVSKSFGSNSVVLLEGVSDSKNLIKQKLTYHRLASSLGLAEQQEIFAPGNGTVRHADMDVEQFSSSTIHLLNVLSRIHADGVTLENIRAFLEASQTPAASDQLWRDILTRRNEHLLTQIQLELKQSPSVIVPWGAAHMPGLARELSEQGFRETRSREYEIFKYREVWSAVKSEIRVPKSEGNPTPESRGPK